MSYHTSGSMGSFGGGYGTIEIALNQTDNLVKGNQYNYNILGGSTNSNATVESRRGKFFLVDTAFDLPDNPPAFQKGAMIQITEPETNAIVLITEVKSIKKYRPKGKKSKKKKKRTSSFSRLIQQTLTQPKNTSETITLNEDPDIVTMKLYDGANIREFTGIETTPISDFLNNVLNDVPVVSIDELNRQLQTVRSYDIVNTKNQKKKKSKLRKKKKRKNKFKLFKNDSKNIGAYSSKDNKSQPNNSLTEITDGVKYNLMVDDPNDNRSLKKKGINKNKFWEITYRGGEPFGEDDRYYEEEPIVRIPDSLPNAYQNSNNEGVEGLLDGRKCGNCVFYEAESENCSKWNALVRDYYWCAAWKTMEPVIAQPNEFTSFINETTNPENNLYNFFVDRLINPTTEEPNLSNFLGPLDAIFSTHGGYLYGDALRRMIDSGNAFDFDNAPLNFFFTTQENFLTAIDFINNGGLLDFEIPLEQYDSVQQHMCKYTLTKKADVLFPPGYPNVLTINLHGSYVGTPINILSQMDFVNGKVAYNPHHQTESTSVRHVLLDSRFVANEDRGTIEIDLLKASVRERLLKFLGDNSKPYYLINSSAVKFVQWVADRSFTSEKWQELYNYLLTLNVISSVDENLLSLIEATLGEELIDEPSLTEIPFVTTLIEAPAAGVT